MKKQSYIHPSPEAGKAFFQQQIKGSVVMLNLLKFKKIADYTEFEDLRPAEEISGETAYKLYMKHTTPLLEKAGSELLFYGRSSQFVIGPSDEEWDLVLLVMHQSVEKFMEFARDPEYLKIAGHRTAALEDSRLLPITK